MSDKIYIVGHKSPDLDSVAAAISYAVFKNISESADIYKPAIAGEPNKETLFALEKYNFENPELLSISEGQGLILVDHNESSQTAEGADKGKIVEVIDHHKIDFKYGEPITFEVLPWGATCTIIADKFFKKHIEIDKNLAGLMLSAILVDTVVTKSPTCTSKDIEIIEKLAEIAGIEDWKQYGMELFKIRSSVKELSAQEIIRSDFKDFNFKTAKIGIGQVETIDLNEFAEKEEGILAELENLKREGGYHSVILFITDIIKEGSKFFVATQDQAKIEEALGTKLDDNKVYIDGIISRKKQVAPKFTEVFDK